MEGEWDQIFDGTRIFCTGEGGTNLFHENRGTNCMTEGVIFCLAGGNVEEDRDGSGFMQL